MSFRAPGPPLTVSPPQPLPLLRPMEVGELLDEAFDLFKKNVRPFVSIAVLLTVPLAVGLIALPPTSAWRYVINVLSFFANLVMYGALTHAVLERHLGREVSLAAGWRSAGASSLTQSGSLLPHSIGDLPTLMGLPGRARVPERVRRPRAARQRPSRARGHTLPGGCGDRGR